MKNKKVLAFILAVFIGLTGAGGAFISQAAAESEGNGKSEYAPIYISPEDYMATDYYQLKSSFESVEYLPSNLKDTDYSKYIGSSINMPKDNIPYIHLSKVLTDKNENLKNYPVKRIIFVTGPATISNDALRYGSELNADRENGVFYNVATLQNDVEIIGFNRLKDKEPVNPVVIPAKVEGIDKSLEFEHDNYSFKEVTLTTEQDLKNYNYVGLRWKYSDEAKNKVAELGYNKSGPIIILDSINFFSLKSVKEEVNPILINYAPSITASDRAINVGDQFNPLGGVTAGDNEDGPIEIKHEHIKENTVKSNVPGEYSVTYRVTDKGGATSEKTIKVVVRTVEKPNAEKPHVEEPNVEKPHIEKTITKGIYNIGKDSSVTITSSGDFVDFKGIKVDREMVEPANYDAKSGSTIVTFKKEYLDTLSVGSHDVEFLYDNGNAKSILSINDKVKLETLDKKSSSIVGKNESSSPMSTSASLKNEIVKASRGNSPKTGDSRNLLGIVSIVILGIGMLTIILKRKNSR